MINCPLLTWMMGKRHRAEELETGTRFSPDPPEGTSPVFTPRSSCWTLTLRLGAGTSGWLLCVRWSLQPQDTPEVPGSQPAASTSQEQQAAWLPTAVLAIPWPTRLFFHNLCQEWGGGHTTDNLLPGNPLLSLGLSLHSGKPKGVPAHRAQSHPLHLSLLKSQDKS